MRINPTLFLAKSAGQYKYLLSLNILYMRSNEWGSTTLFNIEISWSSAEIRHNIWWLAIEPPIFDFN